jgi:transcriptional regulator with XRE-family HTH domain
MSTPSSNRPAGSSAAEGSAAPRAELKAFAGLPQALARLILRDGRSRKEIAEAADLNASMLSGFCSGRRIPSLEHLDRLLTTLGMGIEDLTYEMRTIEYRTASPPPAHEPRGPRSKEEEAASAVLDLLLAELREIIAAQTEEVRALLAAQGRSGAPAEPALAPTPPPVSRAEKAPRRRRQGSAR